jgi:hypothetical protein
VEKWRRVWRDGIAPLLTLPELAALESAIAADDPALSQGGTTLPPPSRVAQDWPVEATCALALCGWKGLCLVTVAEVEEYFARMCHEIDLRLGEPAGCRWFLNFFDETPRDEMQRLLLPEVTRAREALSRSEGGA